MKRYNIIFVILTLLSTSLAESQSVWSPRYSGTGAILNDIWRWGFCPYEGILYAVSDSGTMVYSSDNGDSWNKTAVSVEIPLKGVSFPWPDTGIAVGAGGSIFRIVRTDSVFNFYAIPDANKPVDLRGLNLNDITGQSQNPSLWACGDSGRIIRTVNRGVSWRTYYSPQPPTTKNLNAIDFINFDAIYTVGDFGTLLRSPRVNVWETLIPPEEYIKTNFYGTNFLSKEVGFVVGDSGAIIITKSRGDYWSSQNSGCKTTLRDICFISYPDYDIQIGWVVGDSGVILKTTDLGVHWVRQESGTQRNLRQVFAIDENTIVAVGESGTILTTLPIIEIVGPVFSACPTALSFGKILNSTLKVGSILVTNRGVQNLEITSVTSTAGSFTPQLTSATIPVSQSLEFPILYTPTGDIIDTALITFVGNFEGSPFTINASGGGIDEEKCGWISQNPLSFIPQVRDIKYLGSNNFVAIGEMDSILHSTNSGEKWSIRQCNGGILNHMNAITSPAPLVGVAVGEYGNIIKTVDGGYNWTFQESRTTNTLVAVSFSSAMIGFAVGLDKDSNSTIHRTVDGGNTWTTVYATAGIPLNAIYAVNDDVAIAVGHAIVRTSDGGITWIRNNTYTWDKCYYGPYLVFNDITFLSPNVGVAVGDKDIVARTSDSGLTWTVRGIYDPSVNLTEIETINESRSVLYGRYGSAIGAIYYTTDSGIEWNVLTNSYEVEAISLVDSSYGIAMVKDLWVPSYKLMKCVNGIEFDPIQIDVPLYNLRSVSFCDLNNGVAVGNGTLVRTTNGGVNWTPFLSGTLMEYLKIPIFGAQCINETTLTAVCYDGTIIRSSDGGLNWLTQECEKTSSLLSVYFLDELNGYSTGYAKILHTTDGGYTWLKQQSPIQTWLTSISFTDPYNGVAAGWEGTVLQTSNGGTDWTPRVSGINTILTGISLHGQLAIAIGDYGKIIRSTNGGITWSLQSSNTLNGLNGISMVDDWYATVVGNEGTILRSTDGGITWSNQISGTIADLYGVHFINSDTGTVVGENGTILRTVTGGKLFKNIKIADFRLPDEFLLCQNYPNPFNPVTRFEYQLPIESKVNLKIFNVLGQMVGSLVDGIESAGYKSVIWNASNVASGVYFYRLEATSFSDPSKTFTQVKKMVLVR